MVSAHSSPLPPEPLALLERLIAFDTVSARSNLALIDWVADYLRSHGLAPLILPNAAGTKANLYATIGPDIAGGVVLSGHTDVVPVTDQEWHSDPFTLTARGDRLFGRGTADMKGFLALALAMVPELRARRLSRPVHLAFSYDEEVGCLGVPHLLQYIIGNLPRPVLAVVGEPTMMRPANAHKGVNVFRTTILGKDAHASLTSQGANAILHAARLIRFIDWMADRERRRPDPNPQFDPPHGSLNVGTIEGGTALNIIARRCAFTWDYRPLPADDETVIPSLFARHVAATALPRLWAEWPEGAIETERMCAVPALRPDPEGPAETLVRRITGANAAGTVPFGTEAGLFQRAGIPVVVIGPGDIAQAHQPDEYISRTQLAEGQRFLTRLADWAAS